jgi:hypothetical protein
MRSLAAIRCFLLVLVATAAPAFGQFAGGPDPHALEAFAREVGLQDVRGFVSTVETLRGSGRLPERYVSKEAARAHGWRGGGLCSVRPGQMIGGDIYRNLSEELPPAPGRFWHEADLDATCRSRGPKRLIFSSDGLIYVTVDHYNFFTPVP